MTALARCTGDAEKVPSHRFVLTKRHIDPVGLSFEVQVERTHHDPGVSGMRPMQTHEVSSIERDDRAAIGKSKVQDGFVLHRFTSVTHVSKSHDVVTKAAQGLDDRERKVLVGEQARHGSLRRFVLADLPVDLVAMRAHVGPCVGEIFGLQGGVCLEQHRFSRAKPASLLQEPDGNAGAHDRRVTAAYSWNRIDAGKRIAQFLGHALEQPGFFTRCHAGQEDVGIDGHVWRIQTDSTPRGWTP